MTQPIQSGNRLQHLIALTRLNRPIGIWLLMWPCWWGLTLASDARPAIWLLAAFALGAALMRSAGCIVNDLADREFDRQVARTRTRPLASGALRPYDAVTLCLFLCATALLLILPMHPHTLYWAAGSLLLVAAYPFMKRITYWPQAFLGLTFNLGALLSAVAVHGAPDLAAWLLYAGGVVWTIGYDTLYAHQDIEDDLRIGVKSTAIRFGERTKLAVSICYMLFAASLFAIGLLREMGYAYYLFCAMATLSLAAQIWRVELKNPASCLRAFKANHATGMIIFAAFLLSH